MEMPLPRVAIIQDGTEVARQVYADIASSFERCCDMLSLDGSEFVPTTFTDEAVGYLLDRIDPAEYACLVFSSNALLSGQVNRALMHQRESLLRYLAAGGGLVLLHQLCDSLEAVLPDELCVSLLDRRAARGSGRAELYDPADALLHYPITVPTSPWHDGGPPAGPPALYYKTMKMEGLPDGFKPVMTFGPDVLVARTYDHVPQRLVVATPPLDWQRSVELLANAIRYVTGPPPSRLVWRDDEHHTPLLRRWLATGGTASIRVLPAVDAALPAVDRWLLANVDSVVAPMHALPELEARTEIQSFLARGGTLLTSEQPAHLPASRITILAGNQVERSLSARLYGELRAVTDWKTVQYAFELRNIVAVVALLENEQANWRRGAVRLAELAALREPVRERLLSEEHHDDLSSSIALAVIHFLISGGMLPDELVAWMALDPRGGQFEVAVQLRGVRVLVSRQADPGFLAAAGEALAANRDVLSSLGPLVRVLDMAAHLDQVQLLGDPSGDGVELLAAQTCELLDSDPPDARLGWLSIEATADLARGLVVLLDRIPPGSTELAGRLSEHLAIAVGALHTSIVRYERNRRGVAWLSRVAHALILVERRFPNGLQRLASLDWPDQPAGDGGADYSLLEHLTAENGALREDNQDHERQRLAAMIGRGTATLLGVLIVTVPFVWGLTVVKFGSIWEVLGDIALIVSVYLGLIFAIFTLLARADLLPSRADRLRRWLADSVPITQLLRGLNRE
jgi:hypothetical protein